jgi:molybdate transport system permease protein
MARLFKGVIGANSMMAALLLVVPVLSLYIKISPMTFINALGNGQVFSPLFLSLITSGIATLIAFILGVAVAYTLVFKDIPFKKPFNTLVTLPLVLPPSVAGYLLLITFGRYGTIGRFLNRMGITVMFTVQAVILAQVFVILPFIINSLKTSFEELDPNYRKAAEILGASDWYTFRKVIMPLSRGGIFIGTMMAFARAMGEFGATMLVSGLNETMTIAIYKNAMSGKRLEADILASILIIVSFCVLLLSSRLQARYFYGSRSEFHEES